MLRGYLAMSGDLFITTEGWALLVSRGWRPRMLPKISLGGGAQDSPMQQRII